MGFFERLFCSHNYICVRNFTADDGYLISAWRCEYCGKEITKRGQRKVYVSTQNATPRKSHYSSTDTSNRNDDFMNPLNPLSPNYIGNHSISSSKHTHDCQPSHSHDYGGSHSSSDSCSSSSDSSSSSSSSD